MNAFVLDRENAGIRIVAPRAVLQLAETEIRKCDVGFQRLYIALRKFRSILGEKLLERVDARFCGAAVHILLAELAPQDQTLDRIALHAKRRLQAGNFLWLQIPGIVPGAFVLRECAQGLHHVEPRALIGVDRQRSDADERNHDDRQPPLWNGHRVQERRTKLIRLKSYACTSIFSQPRLSRRRS